MDRIAALVFGTLLGLLGAEAVVRLIVPAQQFWSVAPVYRAVADQQIRYTLAPNLQGIAYGVDLRTNSLGFRGGDWQRVKAPDALRIALIGDSHGFGLGVHSVDTAAEVAGRALRRRMHRPVEILNFAVNGYNSEQELGVLRAYALEFAPDLVVLQISSNDHEAAAYADPYGYLTMYADVAATPRSAAKAAIGWLARHSRIYLWARRRLVESRSAGAATTSATDRSVAGSWPVQPGWMSDFDEDDASEALQASVGRPVLSMVALAKTHGIGVILASYADWLDYRRLLRRIARDEHVPWLELLGLFPEVHSYPELVAHFGLGWDPHLGATAHARWGRALAHVLFRTAIGGLRDRVAGDGRPGASSSLRTCGLVR